VNVTDSLFARNNSTNIGNVVRFLNIGSPPAAPQVAEPQADNADGGLQAVASSAIIVAPVWPLEQASTRPMLATPADRSPTRSLESTAVPGDAAGQATARWHAIAQELDTWLESDESWLDDLVIRVVRPR
jgi:hypothetical protein